MHEILSFSPITTEYFSDEIARQYQTVLPPLIKRQGGLVVWEWSNKGKAVWRLFDNKDHPNMKHMVDKYPRLPRAVKRLYSREFQLNILRMEDCGFAIKVIDEAYDAFSLYLKNTGQA